ncbi:hypothetical protein QMO14_17020 [Variovorax sp. CAN2819]|uniref:hypothetical protein n=1 Tax=Variovorax sp. CAN15 TaxID=3046727 RepID=UPI002647CF93|nr:hypothetical protein [Variovorax sp. CAN15]MDN6885310.1 hypothetical protein [Variovorax sp. CAN15]
MAESWIKMRASLLTNPKVIRTARALLDDAEFQEWFGITLRHGASRHASQTVTERDETSVATVTVSVTDRHAQRHAVDVTIVTRIVVGASVPLWSQANDCAGEDGFLEGAGLFEIDSMSGVPGLGRAMQAVGWIELLPNGEGLRFSNFNEHNTVGKERSAGAKTGADRSREYRERLKKRTTEEGENGVTKRDVTQRDGKRDASRDTVTTEKRRVEKKRKGAKAPMSADNLPTWMTGLVDLYHEVLPELPGVRVMDKARDQALRDFRDWVLTSKRQDGTPRATNDAEVLDWAREYFGRARNNDFIMGRGPRSPDHQNWRCSIEYLLSSRGMKKVIEETADQP